MIAHAHDFKSFGNHVQCRICPSPRPFRLFAAEGLDQDPEAWRTGQGRPPAGAGADRHRQHVRGAGIFRQDGRLRHPADHRLRARDRFRRSGSGGAQCAGRGTGADRAAGGARARLSQPDAAEFAGVSGDADPSGPAHQVRMAAGRRRGPDRADRRAGRPDLAGDPCRPSGAGGDALRPAGQPVRRPALYRTAAPRHREGAPRRSRPDRSRLCQGLAAGGDQRAAFCHRGRLRSPRRAAVHRRRTAGRRNRSRAADPGSPLQDPRRNGGAVRRRSGSAGLDGRDRRTLRVPPGDAQADPAALYGRRCRQPRTRSATKPRNCAARPRRVWPIGSGSTALRRARPRKPIARGWPSRSTSSPAWNIRATS